MYQCPTHVVVDTLDGYVFRAGGNGILFDKQSATEFASLRNSERKPQYQSYKVFRLVEESRNGADQPTTR
jgi:hypothetical protein